MFCFWVTLSSGYLALYILMPSMLNHSSHVGILRSEEHTSELQSQSNIVCRLLLEKKNQNQKWCPASSGFSTTDSDNANYTFAHTGSLSILRIHVLSRLGSVDHVITATIFLPDPTT